MQAEPHLLLFEPAEINHFRNRKVHVSFYLRQKFLQSTDAADSVNNNQTSLAPYSQVMSLFIFPLAFYMIRHCYCGPFRLNESPCLRVPARSVGPHTNSGFSILDVAEIF